MEKFSGLIIKSPHIEEILAGRKLWEMRSERAHKKGLIGLIKQGTKTIVGVAELVGCEGPFDKAELLKHKNKHRIAGKGSRRCS